MSVKLCVKETLEHITRAVCESGVTTEITHVNMTHEVLDVAIVNLNSVCGSPNGKSSMSRIGTVIVGTCNNGTTTTGYNNRKRERQ